MIEERSSVLTNTERTTTVVKEKEAPRGCEASFNPAQRCWSLTELLKFKFLLIYFFLNAFDGHAVDLT